MRTGWIGVVLFGLALALFVGTERRELWAVAAVCALIAAICLLFALLHSLGKYWAWRRREGRIRQRDAATESPLESALARELEKERIPYEREYLISHTRVDFAFPAAKLAVECDGWRYHHERKEQDARRDAFLRSQGWRVLRFGGDEIRKSPGACVKRIAGYL